MSPSVCCIIPCPSDPPQGWSTFEQILNQPNVTIIAVRDNDAALHPPAQVQIADPQLGSIAHYATELASASFRSAACRNYGHYLAYKQGYSHILALDYDCQPHEHFIEEHLEAFDMQPATRTSPSGWINTIRSLEAQGTYARGFPYHLRDPQVEMYMDFPKNGSIALNMGLWNNVLDLNGMDRLTPQRTNPSEEPNPARSHTAISQAVIPLCGMNTCFLPELTPAYFFLPNFTVNGWTVSRHDDIFGGYILQKLMTKHTPPHVVSFGHPIVTHQKLSDPTKSAVLEHYMHLTAPYWYELCDSVVQRFVEPSSSYISLYAQFADGLESYLSLPLSIPYPYLAAFRELSTYISMWAGLEW